MQVIGIVSKNVITKNRVMDMLGDQGCNVLNIGSVNFDPSGFDLILVDLESPMAELVIKNNTYKCLAFGSKDKPDQIERARQLGCERVYKYGEFFKKILPKFKL